MCETSKLQVQPIPGFEMAVPADVFELHYDAKGLMIRVESEPNGPNVFFREVNGFRLLDEGDLLDWWGSPGYV